MCEHDVAYHPSHFDHIPIGDNVEYNSNRYNWSLGNSKYLWARGKRPLSQLIAQRDVLINQVRNVLALNSLKLVKIEEDDLHRFSSEYPNIDIRHGLNFSPDGNYRKSYYRGENKRSKDKVGHWGSTKEFVKKIGYKDTKMHDRINL